MNYNSNLTTGASYPMFTSYEELILFCKDKLENENGAVTNNDIMAAIYFIAMNSKVTSEESNMNNMQLNNIMAGAELAQQMTDNIEKHRENHLNHIVNTQHKQPF